jgi:dephospho-CoA kinase
MYRVGLTGGIGSGKSSVGHLFSDLGVCVIDADAIAHALTKPGTEGALAIAKHFGPAYFDAQGVFNRDAMRAHITRQPQAKTELEALLHPLIHLETEHQAGQAKGDYLILMIPLLIESGRARERVERICVVDCSPALQVSRVQSRNHWPLAEIERIIALQVSRQDRLAAADDVINNEGSFAELLPQVQTLHQKYLDLSLSVRHT